MKVVSAVSLLVISLSLAGCSVLPTSKNVASGSPSNSITANSSSTTGTGSNQAVSANTANGTSGSNAESGSNAAGQSGLANSTDNSIGSTDNNAQTGGAGPSNSSNPTGVGTGTSMSAADRVVISGKHIQTKNDDITYAVLSGLTNTEVQTQLNQDLLVIPEKLELMSPTDTYTSTFRVLFQAGPILELDYDSYDFPQGAAHGMPNQQIFIMNLETGSLYTMKDLFKPGSSYLRIMSTVAQQEDTNHILNSGFTGVTSKDGFVVTPNGVQVFFYPYEWSAFAAGFPTFDVSYAQLSSVINKNGELWKALQRPDTQQDITVEQADIAKVKSLGYIPTGNGYTNSTPQFAASPAPHGTVLYAFGGTKGENGPSKVFFFDQSRYLGTDTLANHGPTINLRPDGGSSILATYDYQAGTNGQTSQVSISFLWDGSHLHTTPAFPKDFR